MRSWYVYYSLLYAVRDNSNVKELCSDTLDYLLRIAVNEIPCDGSELRKFLEDTIRRNSRKFTQYGLFLVMKRESWFPTVTTATVWRVKEGLGKRGLGGKWLHTQRPERRGFNQYSARDVKIFVDE